MIFDKCRICKSKDIAFVVRYKPYKDYQVNLYDCNYCGCRFSAYDSGNSEILHSNPTSYRQHDNLQKNASTLFNQSNVKELKKALSFDQKNKFIIDYIDSKDNAQKIAEIGCSSGYLSSYFILIGKEFYGYDISETAIRKANETFGKHFYNISDDYFNSRGPYDVIFHVGTIGCVEHPIEFTESLLALLKPNGVLLFNSPNRSYINHTGDLWLSVPPPDLVTLFPKYFWAKVFSKIASVQVHEEYVSAINLLKNKVYFKKNKPKLINLIDSSHINKERNKIFSGNNYIINKIFFYLRKIASIVKSRVGEPFGVYVILKKR
jgi:SAM-dependent methyltransferase